MVKISIGVPALNNATNIRAMLQSVTEKTNEYKQGTDYELAVVDDGSFKSEAIEGIKNVAQDFNAKYIRHEKNRGISAAWNSLASAHDSEYVIIFNDDVKIRDANWLKYLMFFFENNTDIGVVGFPLAHYYPQTQKWIEGPWAPWPALVGAPVGCSFGFVKKAWAAVKNSDGSIGFWDDLVSFSEEIYFGFRVWELGYYNFQLPWPPIENYLGGGQTFGANPHVNVRKPSNYLPLDEYLREMTKYKPRHMLVNAFGEVSRMDYSRMMFAKAYGSKDYWDNPYKEVHERIVTPKPAKKVKWLNKDLQVEEAFINNSGIWVQQ